MKEYLILLRRTLTKHLSEEEMRTLCFDLGIDYDDLSGGNKAGKARELVKYLERRQRVLECIEVGDHLWPDIPWERVKLAFFEAAQQEALDPRRFKPLIEELQDELDHWPDRVERQRERIATGLEEERQRRLEEQNRRHDRKRVRVVGQPPLDVVDYFIAGWWRRRQSGFALPETRASLPKASLRERYSRCQWHRPKKHFRTPLGALEIVGKERL